MTAEQIYDANRPNHEWGTIKEMCLALMELYATQQTASIKTSLLLILAKDKSFDNPSSGNQDMEHEGRLAGIKKDLEQLIETI